MASLTAHCSRCSKPIPGFNKLKPLACPWCWSSLTFVARKRRSDGLFRCFGCHMLTHSSFKFCEVCGVSTFKALEDLAVPSKTDVHHRTVGFQTDVEGVDQCVDTSDFEDTMEISGIFDEDDSIQDEKVAGEVEGDTDGELKAKKKKLMTVESDDESVASSSSQGDKPILDLNDSGISNSPVD